MFVKISKKSVKKMKQSSAANSSSEAVGSLAAMKPVNSLPKPNPSVSNKGLVIVQVCMLIN